MPLLQPDSENSIPKRWLTLLIPLGLTCLAREWGSEAVSYALCLKM